MKLVSDWVSEWLSDDDDDGDDNCNADENDDEWNAEYDDNNTDDDKSSNNANNQTVNPSLTELNTRVGHWLSSRSIVVSHLDKSSISNRNVIALMTTYMHTKDEYRDDTDEELKLVVIIEIIRS